MAKKPKNKEIKLRGHFMPNSHLDREWTLDYQKTRRLTVEFLDSLLDIFEAIPQYTFLLDSQTVPIEDYLAIRPENEERLRSIIEQGRMSIGPWYTAPDCNTITGESIVRNLLVGDRTAKKYGNPMKTGYTPFGFGQISQMPQIYTGFDIDVMFFYRGINSQDCPESEFTWQSPDGTEILCSRFGSKSRYNFFMDVWRPVAYGRDWTYRFYDWDRGDIPFRRVSADEEMEHYFIQRPKMTLNREIVEDCFRTLVEVEKQHFTTPIIPFMQGMDTTRPHPLEAEIVEELQGLMDEGEELFFSTLDKYAAEMAQYVDRKKLRHFEGEMRHLGNPSPHVSGLEHILSGRIRQKTHQSKAERMLTRLAEPFAALTWAEGDSSYPKTYLDTAWKYLLKCHPHDTVAGCGIDKLETDATYRLDQVKSLSGIVFDDALASIITNVNTSKVDKNEIALTVFNPSPRVRTEVVDAYIDMTEGSGIVEYEVVEAETEKIADFTFVYRKPTEKTVRDNSDLTTALVGWMCKTQVVAKDIPAMGWKTYIVRKADPNGRRERIAQSPHRMENENLIVEVLPDATLTITDKNTGKVYSGLHTIVDEGENGNCWEYRAPGENRIISSRGADIQISLEENTALSATIRTSVTMKVPAGMVHNDSYHYGKRGEGDVDLVVDSLFTLRKDGKRVDVKTTIDNQARHHRVRVLFPTDLAEAKNSYAETAYDVVERPIDRDDKHSYAMAPNPQYPALRFAGVSNGKAGLAILTKGIHEYEVTDDPSRTIAFTLMRAHQVTLCTVSYRWERRPDQELSQCFGKTNLEYAIMPHSNGWEKGGVVQESEEFHLPLVPAQSGRNDQGDWPLEGSLMSVSPDPLIISTVKKAEDRNTLVVRLFNSASKAVQGKVTFARKVKSVKALNMNEDIKKNLLDISAKDNTASVKVGKRQVVTFEVTFSGKPSWNGSSVKASTRKPRKKK